jgi:hypothetical protein
MASESQTNPEASTACPNYFRELRDGATRGGNGGFYALGRQFFLCVKVMGPSKMSKTRWRARLYLFYDLAIESDPAKVFAWVEFWIPRIAEMIPAKQRNLFARGIIQEARDSGQEFARKTMNPVATKGYGQHVSIDN